ncbi:enoyl-CoA hydratase [Rhodoligotrophos appendicifer]|uniref:enoyl-CoA hydratase/isomerase family protein n=1 Tax=Rhodoligotrophos appendicifer TaxID=987056 RepID=UPI0011853DBF|nr:enoyl-CoA hydratase/isomerase family protein [Rhodoligotrophos appendicifer]
MTEEVLFERRGRAGLITLNRPQALNALTLGMVRAIRPQLETWAEDDAVSVVVIQGAGEKAFCAGGDIRALWEWGRARDRTFFDFYGEEYQLNALIKHYPKPYVALIDGITMGGGVGLSLHGSHRVATERLLFAMPETGIGFFPDVGGTYFLPRLPGMTGMYLGLAGARVKAEDAMALGLATHLVDSAAIASLIERLAETADVDGTLAQLARPIGSAPIEAERPRIDRHFSGADVETIFESLDRDGGEWEARVLKGLQSKSPTSLKVTHRQLREGARLDFDDCMRLEYRLVHGIFDSEDFYEGVRAVIVDKDQAPKWRPARLEAVSDSHVGRYFAQVPDELVL